MKQHKFISCKIITYGRVNMLEEILHSLLQQDYPKDRYEIIIVNDYPLQKLIFDHPNVKIYNLDKTFDTIGEKENYAIERCKGDIIAVTDDDDIAMSNHLTNIDNYFKEDTNLLHWANAVYYNEPTITAITAVGNSGIVYSKKAWLQIGKSPIENAGGDMTLVTAIHNLGRDKVVLAHPSDNDVSWFYMWGGRGFHQSGMGTDTPDRPNIIQRHSEHIEQLRIKGLIPTGDVQLIPHWNKDYKQMLIEYVKNKKI